MARFPSIEEPAIILDLLSRWEPIDSPATVKQRANRRVRASAPALARTTPALLGLFSWLILAAHRLQRERSLLPRRSAWYAKTNPTFADVLACVRGTLWSAGIPSSMSPTSANGHSRRPHTSWMPCAIPPEIPRTDCIPTRTLYKVELRCVQ
ncbi:MAG: hypothetical protein F4Y80_00695 [Caldilineaceae bacterium SB0665_bin_21]|nr:hypothetical protein [Caldilineaceae bacterium SB0665_bin_21]MYA05452.1 hypothetical protein [Caldilineaceae bacterium SB0664_bin_22]MYC64301.1 hypothetical protein [Caldilineaceae bacterium SB0661_bin_34]